MVRPVVCEQIFVNQLFIMGNDEEHAQTEARFYALGQTDAARLLFFVFTVRGDKLRVISTRDMNKKERRVYQTHEEDSAI